MSSSSLSETFENCYVCIDVEEDLQLLKIADALDRLLYRLEVPHEKTPKPHVSIAYTEGLTNRSNLDEVLMSLTENPFHFKPNGICIMRGQTTNNDYICLKLENNDDYIEASKKITNKFKVKMFKDGFTAHLSLFKIPKVEMSDNHFQIIAKYFESFLSDIELLTKISSNSISVFSSCKKSIYYPFNKK
jgi:2'-5' RNA ligase